MTQFWIVAYRMDFRGTPDRMAHSQSTNVLLAGMHPVIWLSRAKELSPTFHKFGTNHLEWFAEIDEQTFRDAAALNYIGVEDYR